MKWKQTDVIRTNVNKSPDDIFAVYKSRIEIEQCFDFLNNLLDLDRSYMHNKYSFESWTFLNHISLMLSYKLYDLLRFTGLLSIFSVDDFIYHLKYIHKVKVKSCWLTSEISAKTLKLLTSLKMHIT